MGKRFGQIVVAALMALGTVFMPAVGARADSSPSFSEYAIPSANAEPSNITSGSDGALWFTESPNKIGRISTAGAVTEYTITGSNSSPKGITAGPDDALWFAVQGENTIGRITLSGQITLFPLPALTHSTGPNHIAVGSDGALWYTKNGDGASSDGIIGRITTAGEVTEYDVPRDTFYDSCNYNCYDFPGDITPGPDGALWFTSNHNIGRISTSGEITKFPLPPKDINGSQYWPTANNITSGPDGAVWFTETNGGEQNNDSIGRITTSGDITNYSLSATNIAPQGITVGPDGALWFAEFHPLNGNKIGRITTDGDITEYPVPTASSGPEGIAVGSDGAIWFTEEFANQIGRLSVQPTAEAPVQAINAGGDASGNFAADTDFSGGQSYTSTAAVDTSNVTNPAPQDVYQSARYGNAMTYTLPGLTPNADYTLRLHFNELYFGASGSGGVGSRVFNVSVNGTQMLTNFDIFKEAGGANRAVVEQLPATADSDGNVTVQFSAVTDNAMVNGIELYAGTLPDQPTPPTVTSARIAAGGAAVGDFVADTDFNGGSTYSSTAPVDTSNVDNPAPQSVYQACRYGNFNYLVSHLTPNSSFKVRLHFNELYWGTPLAGFTGGAGSRVFNVSINGSQVLSNFDIFQAAGGANIGIVKEFTAQTDSSGQIYIQFASVTDNATVNGIEIVPSN